MLIGTVSDTPSRYHTVAKVVRLLEDKGVACILHCGDIEDAETVRMFHGVPTHFVLGNCDTDTKDLRHAIQESGATLHDNFGNVELGGRKIAWIHGHIKRLFQNVEQSGYFD